MEDKTKPCFIQGNGVVNMNDIIKETGYEKSNIYKDKLFWEQIKYSYTAVLKTYPILKVFITGIIMIVIFGIFIVYTNYKNRKFSTINLTFS